ncbi:MAG: TauD/TfdA family dioxygenase [Candidatus Obscuribacterales bacterium]
MLIHPHCLFSAESTEGLALDHYRAALYEHGIVNLRLNFVDRTAAALKKIVEHIGYVSAHDEQGKMQWDVKYDSNVDPETAARSLTTREFPLHTDASFEEPPPRYVGLFVVQEDSLGGGQTQLLDVRKILPLLSSTARVVLQESQFRFRVPAEFRRERPFIEGPILSLAGDGEVTIRYRHEVLDLEHADQAQIDAISELDGLINLPEFVDQIFLQTGTVLLFDNGRFLHARTVVKDKMRHLVRMRFQMPLRASTGDHTSLPEVTEVSEAL